MTSDDSDDDMGRCEIRFSKGVGYRPVPVGSQENKPKDHDKSDLKLGYDPVQFVHQLNHMQINAMRISNSLRFQV